MSQCLSGGRARGRLILGGRQRPDNVCLGTASASCGKWQVSALDNDRISPLINLRRLYGEWSYQRSGDRSESSRGVGVHENQSWAGVGNGNDLSFFFAIVREHCGSDTFNHRHLSLILVAGETKIKMLAALGLGEDLFLLSRWLPYFCAITWWQA